MAEDTNKTANLLRIYLRDCSLESPNVPAVFAAGGDSQIKLDLNVAHRRSDDDHYEVTLTVQARATAGEKTMFLVEVQQAGLLHIQGVEGDELDGILGSWMPQQLFPFAREVVASLAVRAGFPQVMLPIVDFQQFYLQNKAQRAAGGSVPPAESSGPAH